MHQTGQRRFGPRDQGHAAGSELQRQCGWLTEGGLPTAALETRRTDAEPDGPGPLLSPKTDYTYDPRGNVVTTTLPEPTPGGQRSVLTYEYNAPGEMSRETDPLGRTTTYGIDGLSRLISVTEADPDGGGSPQTSPVTSFSYNSLSELERQTDPLGRVTRYGYDLMSREVLMVDPAGGVSGTTYDLLGQIVRTTDALARSTSYQIDPLGRTTQVTLPDPDAGGSTSSPVLGWTYDAAGNVLSATDARGNTTNWTYGPIKGVRNQY